MQLFAGQWKNFYTTLKQSGHNVKILCHAYREYTALRDSIPSEDLSGIMVTPTRCCDNMPPLIPLSLCGFMVVCPPTGFAERGY